MLSLAESFMSIVLQVLHNCLELGTASNTGSASSVVSSSSSSTGDGISEEQLLTVVKRHESRIARIIFSAMGLSHHGDSLHSVLWASALKENGICDDRAVRKYMLRVYASSVFDVVMAVRGALCSHFINGGVNAQASTAGKVVTSISTLVGPLLARFFTAKPPASTSALETSFRSSGGSVMNSRSASLFPSSSTRNQVSMLPVSHLWGDSNAIRKSCAIVDIVWMQTVFIILGDEVTSSMQDGFPTLGNATPGTSASGEPPRNSPSKIAAETGGGTHLASQEDSSTPQCVPNVVDYLSRMPLSFFFRRQHIQDVENMLCSWMLRDVDVYPSYRRLIQQWSNEIFSLICAVDQSVASPTHIAAQGSLSAAFQTFAAVRAKEMEASSGDSGEFTSNAETNGGSFLHKLFQRFCDDAESTFALPRLRGEAHEHSLLPVAITPPIAFVEKYINGMLSIQSDLAVYKNYAGLLKYARILSSLRVQSNALLIALTSVLVELAGAAKGRREVKSIFSEFAVRLLVPAASTPLGHIDAWVSRNVEFLHMHHLTEWEAKAKYVPVVIPAVAACLSCSSTAYFVRQVLPFCRLVARSLGDADKKIRHVYFSTLCHVLGLCVKRVFLHPVLGQDTAAGALRRDIVVTLQSEVSVALKKQPLTSLSTRAIEAAAEVYLVVIKTFPTDGVALVVDLLPSDASAVHTEATAVALTVLSAVSDVIFSPPSSKESFKAGVFRLAFQVWSTHERTATPYRTTVEDELGLQSAVGIVCQFATPFSSIKKSAAVNSGAFFETSALGSTVGDGVCESHGAPDEQLLSYCHLGKELNYRNANPSSDAYSLQSSSLAVNTAAGTIFGGPPSEPLDDCEAVYRRLGAAVCIWEDESTIRQCRESLNSKEDVLVKKLSSLLTFTRDILNVPRAQQKSAAASTVSQSSLSEREKASQKILLATILVARYWAPVSALFAELPKALTHYNHALVIATSTIVVPHFLVQPEFRMFGQVVVSRMAEAIPQHVDDKEVVASIAKMLVDISILARRQIAVVGNSILHSMNTSAESGSLQHKVTRNDASVRNVVAQLEALNRFVGGVPTLPATYYHLPPFAPPPAGVDLQSYSLLDVLDGAALVLLGSGDRSIRLAAAQITSNTRRCVDSLSHYVNQAIHLITSHAPPHHKLHTSIAQIQRWDAWIPIASALAGTSGRQLVEVCTHHMQQAQAVGCNWAEESKSFRMLGAASIFSKFSLAATVGSRMDFEDTWHLFYANAITPIQVHSSSHQDNDERNNSGNIEVLSLLASSPHPCIFSGNLVVDMIALHTNVGARDASKSLLVAAKISSIICQQVGSAMSLLEDRYTCDVWRSAYLVYATLLSVEPQYTRRSNHAASSAQPTDVVHTTTKQQQRSVGERPLSQSSRGSAGELLQESTWLLPDKGKKFAELLQWTLSMLAKLNGVQDVFDLVTYFVDALSTRVLSLQRVVTLSHDYVRCTVDFVKRFLEDPVKSYARKDKKRALSYCGIATPALRTCATAIFQRTYGDISATNPTSAKPSTTDTKPAHTVPSISTPTSLSATSSHDLQLLLVKFFDAFDALLSVLIIGNFSSTVAGSNAPTSSSTATLTPQQHELLKTGGVSPLASLPPIPPLKTLYTQANLRSSQPPMAQVVLDDNWPFQQVGRDECGGPAAMQLSWSHSPAGMTYEQSFSVRLRATLVDLFGLLYHNESLCSAFLHDRHRLLLEFLFFNIYGAPTRNMIRYVSDFQGIEHKTCDRMYSKKDACVIHSHREGDPYPSYCRALSTFTKALVYSQLSSVNTSDLAAGSLQAGHRSTVSGGAGNTPTAMESFSLMCKLIDNVLEHFTNALAAWQKVTLASRAASSTQLILAATRVPPISCFSRDTPFRCWVERTASAAWAQKFARFIFNRLGDATIGTTQHIFFAELSNVFFLANPKLLYDDDTSSAADSVSHGKGAAAAGVAAHHQHTRSSHQHAASPLLHLENAKAPLVVAHCLILLSTNDPKISESARQDALDLLHVLYGKSVSTAGSVPNADPVDHLFFQTPRDALCHKLGDEFLQWNEEVTDHRVHASANAVLQLLLKHRDRAYSKLRSKNHYNRVMDVVVFFMSSQRLVVQSSWLCSLFHILIALIEVVELSDEKVKTLLSVSRMYVAHVGAHYITQLWSAIDRSSAHNKARVAFRILNLAPEDQAFILNHLENASDTATPNPEGLARVAPPSALSPVSRNGQRAHRTIAELPSTPHVVSHETQPSTASDHSRTAVSLEPRHTLRYVLFCQCMYQLLLRHTTLCGRSPSGIFLTSESSSNFEPAHPSSVAFLLDSASDTPALYRESLWAKCGQKPAESAAPPGVAHAAAQATSLLPGDPDLISLMHFHEHNPYTAAAVSALDARLSAETLAIGSYSTSLFFASASRDAGTSLLRPLASVLHCLSHVGGRILSQRDAACDSAVELGFADSIPSSLYVEQVPRRHTTLKSANSTPGAVLAPPRYQTILVQTRSRVESPSTPQSAPVIPVGARRSRTAEFPSVRAVTPPPPPALLDDGTASMDSDDTVIVHEDSGCVGGMASWAAPTLASNASVVSRDEFSTNADAITTGTQAQAADCVVNTTHFRQELLSRFSEKLVLVVSRSLATLVCSTMLVSPTVHCDPCKSIKYTQCGVILNSLEVLDAAIDMYERSPVAPHRANLCSPRSRLQYFAQLFLAASRHAVADSRASAEMNASVFIFGETNNALGRCNASVSLECMLLQLLNVVPLRLCRLWLRDENEIINGFVTQLEDVVGSLHQLAVAPQLHNPRRGVAKKHVAMSLQHLSTTSAYEILQTLQLVRSLLQRVEGESSVQTATSASDVGDDTVTTFLLIPLFKSIMRLVTAASAIAASIEAQPVADTKLLNSLNYRSCARAASGTLSCVLMSLSSFHKSHRQCQEKACTSLLTEADLHELFWLAFGMVLTHNSAACGAAMLVSFFESGCWASLRCNIGVVPKILTSPTYSSVVVGSIRKIGPEVSAALQVLLRMSLHASEQHDEVFVTFLNTLSLNMPHIAPFLAALWVLLAPSQSEVYAAAFSCGKSCVYPFGSAVCEMVRAMARSGVGLSSPSRSVIRRLLSLCSAHFLCDADDMLNKRRDVNCTTERSGGAGGTRRVEAAADVSETFLSSHTMSPADLLLSVTASEHAASECHQLLQDLFLAPLAWVFCGRQIDDRVAPSFSSACKLRVLSVFVELLGGRNTFQLVESFLQYDTSGLLACELLAAVSHLREQLTASLVSKNREGASVSEEEISSLSNTLHVTLAHFAAAAAATATKQTDGDPVSRRLEAQTPRHPQIAVLSSLWSNHSLSAVLLHIANSPSPGGTADRALSRSPPDDSISVSHGSVSSACLSEPGAHNPVDIFTVWPEDNTNPCDDADDDDNANDMNHSFVLSDIRVPSYEPHDYVCTPRYFGEYVFLVAATSDDALRIDDVRYTVPAADLSEATDVNVRSGEETVVSHKLDPPTSDDYVPEGVSSQPLSSVLRAAVASGGHITSESSATKGTASHSGESESEP